MTTPSAVSLSSCMAIAPSSEAIAPSAQSTDYDAYIGIDWADRKHDIALYDCTTDSWQDSIIQNRPQDILDWVTQLLQTTLPPKLIDCQLLPS